MWILEVAAPRLVRAPRYPRQIARPTIDPHDAATRDNSSEPQYRHSFATVRRDCGRAVATLGVSEDLSSPMKAHSWATLQAVCLGKNLGARSVPRRPRHRPESCCRCGTMRTQPPVPCLPSLASLEATDEIQLSAELNLARLRAQVAIVRALTDQVEKAVHVAEVDDLRERIVEEMARLGCRLFEAAAAMAGSRRREDSGVFLRQPALVPADDLP